MPGCLVLIADAGDRNSKGGTQSKAALKAAKDEDS